MQKKLILASQSPRRKELLQHAGYQFSTISLQVDESYPTHLSPTQVATYLAQKKAAALQPGLKENEVAITADTTVVLDNQLLEKAADLNQARDFLNQLSGKTHQVITGVTVFDNQQQKTLVSETKVIFKNLSQGMIEYYLQNFKPLDKAGAYGIQEWIGLVGIEKIEGSYHNVVGLPVSKLYDVLAGFNIFPQMD